MNGIPQFSLPGAPTRRLRRSRARRTIGGQTNESFLQTQDGKRMNTENQAPKDPTALKAASRGTHPHQTQDSTQYGQTRPCSGFALRADHDRNLVSIGKARRKVGNGRNTPPRPRHQSPAPETWASPPSMLGRQSNRRFLPDTSRALPETHRHTPHNKTDAFRPDRCACSHHPVQSQAAPKNTRKFDKSVYPFHPPARLLIAPC